MKIRNFPSQNQACMIYKDLRESYSLHQERTQERTDGDRCFGHLPVVGCLPDEERLMRFLLVSEHTPVEQNVILSLRRKPIT